MRTRKPLSMKGEESVADFGAVFNGGEYVTINSRPDDEPVQDGLDEGMFILAYLEVTSEIALDTIDTNAAIPLQTHLLEHVLPALTEDLEHWRPQFHLRAWGQLQHALQHLPRRTRRDRFLTPRAIGRPERRIEHAEVIPKIGHRADGRTRITADRFLVDRNDGRQTVNEIDVRLAQLIHEPLGVSGHRCQQASLPFGIKRIESQ